MKIISLLKANKFFDVVFALVYYIIVVTTHKPVGRFVAQNLDMPLGREKYNLLVVLLSLVMLLLLVFSLKKSFKSLLSQSEQKKVLTYLGFLFLIIVISFNMIVVVNVEVIHIAQYCIMAILLFPLIKSYNHVMVFTTILGVLDEAYQYWYLFPEKSDYFDFNDVIINFTGVILGLIILRSQGVRQENERAKWIKSPLFYLFIFLTFIILLGFKLNLISITPNTDDAPTALIELVRIHKPGFWRIIPPNVKFHVIRPIEFVFLILGLMFCFRKLGD